MFMHRITLSTFVLIDPEVQTLEAFELDEQKTYLLVTGISYNEEFIPSLFPNLTLSLKELWQM